ncbi:C45 family peptidase [Jatrophihabitans telluris]|uniref:C45 family peptidase n=1 Tax=Jatrophihabitans telluris TaxID=2038343 RepID=A0ABY4R099_9ACTN|nr:C45 family peptidase [Jatrophihabitans telluris]UQX89213.1 C45 family peptidase [Jatrophihabitans telluris]
MVTRFVSEPASPRHRGEQFGEAHREPIARTLSAYSELFSAVTTDQSWSLPAFGAQALDRIEAWTPELAEELHGIARGCGQTATTIAALNARTEILAALRNKGGARTPGECSTIVALGADHMVAVQNWDWFVGMAGNWLVWEIEHADGRRTTTVTEYGILAKIGVNSAGVGALFNILHHRADGHGPVGVPVHVIARAVLDTAVDVDSALSLVSSATVSASTALTVMGPGAEGPTAVTAEIWPGGPSFVPALDDLLLHTNHFLAPEAAEGDTEPTDAPDTIARYEVLQRELVGRGHELDVAGAVAVLTDHAGGSGALCCHPDPADPQTEQYQTLATVRLDLAQAAVHCTAGTPCLASTESGVRS